MIISLIRQHVKIMILMQWFLSPVGERSLWSSSCDGMLSFSHVLILLLLLKTLFVMQFRSSR